MITDIQICSAALIMLGEEPITSFEDGTTTATVMNALYETTVRDLLSRYRWRFASGQLQMSLHASAPASRYEYAYQLPADPLNIHGVIVNDEWLDDFDRYRDMIFCDVGSNSAVYVDFTERCETRFFAPTFVGLLQDELASRSAMPITQKVELANFYEAKSLRQFQLAKTMDAQGQTTRRVNTSRLVRARMGAGSGKRDLYGRD